MNGRRLSWAWLAPIIALGCSSSDTHDGDLDDDAHPDADVEVGDAEVLRDADEASDADEGRDADVDADEHDADREPCTSLSITVPVDGHLYLDDTYTGLVTPVEIPAPSALPLRIGVGADDALYVERTIDGDLASCEVALDEGDAIEPRVWRGLFVGVRTASFEACAPSFSTEQLDAVYDFFEESMSEHLERLTMSLHTWELDRVDEEEPVAVTSPHGYLTMEPQSIPALDVVADGEYDVIVVAWRGVDERCQIDAPYFGLSSPPTADTKGAGWIAVRTPEADVISLLAYLRAMDPGVFIHEWLHVAVEWHYAMLGAELPQPASDGSIVHNGEGYGYAFPWMDWYRDLISGRVADGGDVVGVTPDLLRACTFRSWVTGECP